MKNRLLMRLWAIMLVLCLAVTSVSAVEIMRVYASEEADDDSYYSESKTDDDPDDGEYEPHAKGLIIPTDIPDPSPIPPDPDPSPIPPDPDPSPVPPSPDPDPTDYAISVYNANIDFGQIHEGDVVLNMYFQVVNVGNNPFNLAWDEIDPNTGFLLACNGDTYLDPGDKCDFSVVTEDGIRKGEYNARYVFYSADDPTRAHSDTATAHVSVLGAEPYITSVTVTGGASTVAPGKSLQYNAEVSGGYDFDKSVIWSVNGNNSSSTSIDGNGLLSVSSSESAAALTVIATSCQDPSKYGTSTVAVKKADHVVTVQADPADGGAVTGGGAVSDGGSVNLSASANNNYAFKGWYEAGSLISSSTQARIDGITADRTFIARFDRKSCYVRTSVNDPDAGSVTDSAGVPYGGNMTITARANDGYVFDKFVENKQTISTTKTLQLNNITSDRNITAVFKKSSYKINVAVNPQGAGSIDGADTYARGEKCVLAAYPASGYIFTGWLINGSVVSTSTTYTIDPVKNDVSLVACFMKQGAPTYRIVSGIANEGGSITPSGDYVVAQGGSVTYNIMPSAGYRIQAVMVDGLNIGTVSTYTFNNVTGNHAIAASFERKPVEVTKAPASPMNSTNSTTVVVNDNTDDMKNTVYNDRTAAEGAVPEQQVVYTDVPDSVTTPDPEQHADDVYTILLDEQPGASSAPAESVMAKHALDEDSLRLLIREKNDLPLLREAYEDGNLMITVNNSYAADKQETAVGLYHDNPTITNFEDVIAESLTEDEKVSVLTGNNVSFNIDISDSSETIDKETKNALSSKVGYKPISYFDFVILKTAGGVTSILSNTGAELEVVLPIPPQYRKNGRKFCVIRDHNGEVDILKDIGNDPNNVTFRTDRFSEYAIAYEAVSPRMIVLRFSLIALVGLLLALLCFVELVHHRRKMRIKARREAILASEMKMRELDERHKR